MFLLQLQLYFLIIIRVTLRRIQKPLGESPYFVSLNIPYLVKGTKKVIVISLKWLYQIVIHWSIVLAKIDLVALYFRLLWNHSILRGSIDQKHAKTKEHLETKQWNPPSFRLLLLASMISRSFQTVWRMREEWEWETYVRSQSFLSESVVKYLHVGRRKIEISPPLGEQDQSNALPQGQQRQSNPHSMPCLPHPRRHNIDRCTMHSPKPYLNGQIL